LKVRRGKELKNVRGVRHNKRLRKKEKPRAISRESGKEKKAGGNLGKTAFGTTFRETDPLQGKKGVCAWRTVRGNCPRAERDHGRAAVRVAGCSKVKRDSGKKLWGEKTTVGLKPWIPEERTIVPWMEVKGKGRGDRRL